MKILIYLLALIAWGSAAPQYFNTPKPPSRKYGAPPPPPSQEYGQFIISVPSPPFPDYVQALPPIDQHVQPPPPPAATLTEYGPPPPDFPAPEEFGQAEIYPAEELAAPAPPPLVDSVSPVGVSEPNGEYGPPPVLTAPSPLPEYATPTFFQPSPPATVYGLPSF